jgi:phage terminase large subunit-like protein
VIHHNSESGAFETACHLTGDYPDWWPGRRFDHPVDAWAAGVSSTVVRDVQQAKLCGKPGVDEMYGTGYIPRDRLLDHSMARGATDAYDSIQVRHKSGGVSTLGFKSYEQGREKFQAATLHFIWWDEEPPPEVYSEGLTRITATRGMEFLTFTPLQGRSEVVMKFLDEFSEDRAVVVMTIVDAKHISPEERASIIAGYPAHEREARVNGTPMLGSGRIFLTSEENIKEPYVEDLPPTWVKIWGVDFGIDHPFAAVLCAWDRDNDIFHVLHGFKASDTMPINHAAAMKPKGINVPVAWPSDGHSREKGSGVRLSVLYKEQGLRMLPTHATWPDGSVSTEAGVAEMAQRFANGMLKVSAHLEPWFEEYRFYHRKDGMIVKIKDDLLSATRTALMMRRFAIAVPLGGQMRKSKSSGIASGMDFDVFA